MACIEQHNACSVYTLVEINSWLREILLVFYYMVVPDIDFGIILLIYEKNVFLRISMAFVIIFLIINFFVVSYLLSSIGSNAHNSYHFLNSLIARKRMSLRLKFKTLSLIERLSGPLIGIYCYDLFPFTNEEIYLFIVNCVSNFTLLIGIFDKFQ